MKGKKYLLGVRVDPDLMAWLRRAAAKERVTVSHIVRRQLLVGFEARHAKYVPRDPAVL